MLLLYAVSGMSFKLLALCADALGIAKISDTAWRKRMLHAKEWLREILNHSLTTLVSSNLSDQSRDVYLIDGSTIRQEGKKQKQVRIHMSYNLKKNCMQEIKVTDYHGAESFSHYTMKKNDIFMADSLECCRKAKIFSREILDSGRKRKRKFQSLEYLCLLL